MSVLIFFDRLLRCVGLSCASVTSYYARCAEINEQAFQRVYDEKVRLNAERMELEKRNAELTRGWSAAQAEVNLLKSRLQQLVDIHMKQCQQHPPKEVI